jgi:DNA polymerase
VADSGQRDLLLYLRDLRWRDVDRGIPASESDGAGIPAEGTSPDNLSALARTASSCQACRLAAARRNVVFGVGNPHARLMFVGEGPGADEDARGEPFVGRAGQLLTAMLRAMGLQRQDVYIANIVKCRPPGNREPQPDEVAACRGYLEAQIDAIRPRVLVALGRVAAQTLLGNDTPIGKMRGQWFEVRGVPVMVTYHPAALLRNPSLKRPTWEDMQQVRDRLAAADGDV